MTSKRSPQKSLEKLLAVIYYTSNREDEAFESKIKAKLLKTIGNLPLISVSQKPINFGKNICVGNVGISNQNAFRQLQLGAINAKTPFVVAAEADCLYPKEYFEYVPGNLNMCCRYDNVWVLYKNSKVGFLRKEYSKCAQVWGRENLIRHIERRLKGRGYWNPTLEHGNAVPAQFGKQSWVYFHGKIPIINIKTTEGMHPTTEVIKGQKPNSVSKLPFWGTTKRIRKEMFSNA